jgi:hypothetical protein
MMSTFNRMTLYITITFLYYSLFTCEYERIYTSSFEINNRSFYVKRYEQYYDKKETIFVELCVDNFCYSFESNAFDNKIMLKEIFEKVFYIDIDVSNSEFNLKQINNMQVKRNILNFNILNVLFPPNISILVLFFL